MFSNGKISCCDFKKVSIPRLKLVATRLGNFVRKELYIIVDEVYYWTDATAVSRYINILLSRFETFVGSRIEMLHTLISVSQWRCVFTEENPAATASRRIPPKEYSHAPIISFFSIGF